MSSSANQELAATASVLNLEAPGVCSVTWPGCLLSISHRPLSLHSYYPPHRNIQNLEMRQRKKNLIINEPNSGISKVKALVAQLCPTLCNRMDCSLTCSSVHVILQARILDGLPCPPPGDLPDPMIESWSPASQVDSLSHCCLTSGILKAFRVLACFFVFFYFCLKSVDSETGNEKCDADNRSLRDGKNWSWEQGSENSICISHGILTTLESEVANTLWIIVHYHLQWSTYWRQDLGNPITEDTEHYEVMRT